MDMGTYGYSLGSTLGALLYVIVKVLIIVLAVVVVLGVIVWIRDNLFRNDSSKIVQTIKSDPLLKAVSVITLAVVGLVLLFAVLNGIMNPGLHANYNMGRFQGTMNASYNPAMGIEGILVMLIRILMFILVVSLALAAFMYVKTLYENGKLNMFSTTSVPPDNTVNDINGVNDINAINNINNIFTEAENTPPNV
jgi:hypothetical protein